MRKCLLCGHELPKISRWQRLKNLGMMPPLHDVRGPEADLCWVEFNRAMGVTQPGPRPTR